MRYACILQIGERSPHGFDLVVQVEILRHRQVHGGLGNIESSTGVELVGGG